MLLNLVRLRDGNTEEILSGATELEPPHAVSTAKTGRCCQSFATSRHLLPCRWKTLRAQTNNQREQGRRENQRNSPLRDKASK